MNPTEPSDEELKAFSNKAFLDWLTTGTIPVTRAEPSDEQIIEALAARYGSDAVEDDAGRKTALEFARAVLALRPVGGADKPAGSAS